MGIGGLIGYNVGLVSNCSSSGLIIGSHSGGGLIGDNWGTVSNCYSSTSVNGSEIVGGLIGQNKSQGIVNECYSTGPVSLTDWYWYGYIGGLIGINEGNMSGCYSTGSVSEYFSFGGGLAGCNSSGTLTTCFWDIQMSGLTDGVGDQDPDPNGVSGKTMVEMQTLATFTSLGWDFTDTDGDPADWMMLREGEDYPRLVWQQLIMGDIAGLYGVNMVDFARIASHWQQTGCPSACENADINGDGTVNIMDLSLLADHWLEERGAVVVSEHVYHIEVWYDAAHDNPLDINQVEYEFDIEVVTDGNVARMEFITPEGKTFSIPSDLETWDDANQIWTSRYFNENGGVWEWEFEKFGSNINLFDDFGDGTYTLKVFYADNSYEQTQIGFADPCTDEPLPMPTQIPSVIFPAYQATVESPITVSWEQCIDPNVNGIWVDLWNDAIGADFGSPFDKEQTSWESVDLNDGWWYVGIDFDNYCTAVNADGIEVGTGKSRNSEQSFTVGKVCPESVVGDLGGDCNVDFADLEVLAEQWLQPPITPSADIAPQPNGDGIVNFLDFALMAENWMK
jgi:hypothetical protein